MRQGWHWKVSRDLVLGSLGERNLEGGKQMAQTILRLPDVKARTGLSRSTIYLRLAEGSFPRPVSLGARSIGFVEAEIDAWVDERIRARPDMGRKSGRP